jgi:predicted MPP superfamily phosphohydrolase
VSELFWALAAATAIGIPLYAWGMRGREYALFAVIILAIALPGALLMHGRYRALCPPDWRTAMDVAFAYAMAAAGAHLASLVTPRLRRGPFRLAVSIPGMVFIAAGALAGVWLLALLPLRFGLELGGFTDVVAALRWLDVLPFAVAILSVVTSARPVEEVVRVLLAKEGPPAVTRVPVERYRRRRPAPLAERPLRIVQIADPHLGPWQPVRKLRGLIERLIEHDPDLVLLTGDFLTMEGTGTPGALVEALAPLRRVSGRCFAIFGNHDHDRGSLDEVRRGLDANGIHLLVDEDVIVETAVGPVQIVGADYVGRGRREHIRTLLERLPRRADHLRILLLHDPLGFQFVPVGDVDLTLSGHTHGGQLGLVSFGYDWTVLSRTRWPDHGLFGHGSNRLYVHRGSGFYGFPLRIGVPGEASLLELVRA